MIHQERSHTHDSIRIQVTNWQNTLTHTHAKTLYHVSKRRLHAKNVLVKRARKVRVDQMSVVDRLANEAPDKLKELEVIGIVVRQRIRLKHVRRRRRPEERVIRIEDLTRHDHEPFARDATRVDALLALELDIQTSVHVLRGHATELLERVLKHLRARKTKEKTNDRHSKIKNAEKYNRRA